MPKTTQEIIDEEVKTLLKGVNDPCGCEECIDYNKALFIKSLDKALKNRDTYWQEQEMGKSCDCAKHCEDAVKEAEENILNGVRQDLHSINSKIDISERSRLDRLKEKEL